MKLNCSLSLLLCGSGAVFVSGLVFFIFVRVELQMGKRENQQQALIQRLSAIEKRVLDPVTKYTEG